MKTIYLILLALVFCLNTTLAEEKPKNPIPPIGTGEDMENRDSNFTRLYQDDSYVYIYSEKQLDNLTIGITDIQGNTYHYEVTTVPACTYYAIPIGSLPTGQYYFCIYQRIIDRDTDIGTFSTEINEEYQELVNSSRF